VPVMPTSTTDDLIKALIDQLHLIEDPHLYGLQSVTLDPRFPGQPLYICTGNINMYIQCSYATYWVFDNSSLALHLNYFLYLQFYRCNSRTWAGWVSADRDAELACGSADAVWVASPSRIHHQGELISRA
jgi:hypothetical protein